MLATTYALHFAKNQLVDMYCEMKRSKDEDLIADVHSFSAGESALHSTLHLQDRLVNSTMQQGLALQLTCHTAVAMHPSSTTPQ